MEIDFYSKEKDHDDLEYHLHDEFDYEGEGIGYILGGCYQYPIEDLSINASLDYRILNNNVKKQPYWNNPPEHDLSGYLLGVSIIYSF